MEEILSTGRGHSISGCRAAPTTTADLRGAQQCCNHGQPQCSNASVQS